MKKDFILNTSNFSCVYQAELSGTNILPVASNATRVSLCKHTLSHLSCVCNAGYQRDGKSDMSEPCLAGLLSSNSDS
jgi:hypothetical protein